MFHAECLIYFSTFAGMKRYLLLLLLCTSAVCQAQDDWQQAFRQLSDVEDLESEAWEENYEALADLAEHPLDLNQATREDLEALPFLSDQQVEDIMAYRYRHGELLTAGELQMIPSLSYEQRQLLLNFVFLGQQKKEQGLPRLDSLWSWGKQEVSGSLNVPFYRRRGDKNGYLGYPYKHTLRYKFRYGTRLQFGLLGTQDAGEPFFSAGNNWGYDHYAWHFIVRRMGCIEALAVGQYRLSFGMGLTMNGGFSLGKLAMLQNLGRTSNTIRPNTSRMTSGYMQGAAATIRIPNTSFSVTAYASLRPIDATLNKTDSTAATLLTDGYHRTPAEMQKKHNVTETDAGLHLSYRTGGLHLGGTLTYTHLNRRLQPDTKQLYRRHYPAGSDFMNAAIDYRYAAHRVALNGETAIDGHGSVATINSLSYQPAGTFTIVALQRYYSYRYMSLHARSFAEGGRTQNESGIYLGTTWRPTRRLQLSAYTDYAWFAWPKYLISQSSYSWDNMLTATYTARQWTASARYRLHIRQRDNADKTALTNRAEQRGRLALTTTAVQGFSLHTQLDLAHTDYDSHDFGYMVSQRVSSKQGGVKWDAGVGYFHTDSYNARLYLYERAPLYQMAFPMFYGEGIRYWLMAQLNLLPGLAVTAKLGVTNYFDRATIGTDKQLIDHSSMADLNIQVIYKF